MDEHDLRSKLHSLDLKAQLLGRVPLGDLNLRDTPEKIAVGFLAALHQTSELIDRYERESQAEIPGPCRRLRAWLRRFRCRN